MQSNQPIGIFDSGIGGLTILKSLIDLMPYENYIYLGDSYNAPYGNKTTEEIIKLSEKSTRFLIEQNAKIIVVACNTATGKAIDYLRKEFSNYQFIGLEPAIKPACLATVTGNIGVLATQGTFDAQHYKSTSHKYSAYVNIHSQIGFGLVDIAETNKIDSQEALELLQKYINPLIKKNIDHLVLGCTHYPFFNEMIKKICGENIKVIDSGEAVARRTKDILMQNELIKTEKSFGHCKLFTTGNINIIKIAWQRLNKSISNSCEYTEIIV